MPFPTKHSLGLRGSVFDLPAPGIPRRRMAKDDFNLHSGRDFISKVATPPDVNPCGGGGGTPSVSWTCVSRQGNGTLRGWSKFDNCNAGDWNTRKAVRSTISVSWDWPIINATYYNSTSAFPNGCDGGVCGYLLLDYNGLDWIWDPVSNTKSQSVILTQTRCGVFQFNHVVNPGDLTGTHIGLTPSSLTYTDWTAFAAWPGRSDTCFRNSDDCCGRDRLPFVSSPYSATHSHVVFDTVSAALARGSPTLGTSCRTNPGSIGSTINASVGQLAITGPKSVDANFSATNLLVGHDYKVTITQGRYVDQVATTPLDQTSSDVFFTAAATTETFVFYPTVDDASHYQVDSAVIVDVTP